VPAHRRKQAGRIDDRQHHDEQEDDPAGERGCAELTASQQRAPPGPGRCRLIGHNEREA